ncbi:hypothetical protein IU449_27385 [Nocardia higoensis]|uniref:Uncharacterized protein n=1 Tax=Nocardia higoensis TaxID=228599 RepID=A0ABS0DID4_9NOCA|nr:hypothetical protein [Nocardia higoensis]MBF6358225.1 hypothetical protein [Nocardia higoensis]
MAELLKRTLRDRANRLILEHPFHSLYEFATALIDDVVDGGLVHEPGRVIETDQGEDTISFDTTALDVLGPRTVILLRGHVYQHAAPGWWSTPMSDVLYSSEQVMDVAGGDDITILHIPNEEPANA